MKIHAFAFAILAVSLATGRGRRITSQQAICAAYSDQTSCTSGMCFWCEATPDDSSIVFVGKGGHCVAEEHILGGTGKEGAVINCAHGDYRRVLSDFDERRLFSLMKGEELERHLLKYEEKKDMVTSLGICDNEESTHHGMYSTHKLCFDPANQGLARRKQEASVDERYEPWRVPSTEGADLLASNPGIWSIENFLTDDEMNKLLDLIDEYGHGLGMFGPCKYEKRHPTNAHPSENKVCFKISSERVCDGPYDISECSTKTREKDSIFVSSIFTKFKEMWSTNVDIEYAKFQIASGGTAPVDLHLDDYPITFVLYLNDGGAAMIFPNANVTVTPKRGAAYTWLNQFEDGSSNPMADHAVQAHPKDAGERGVMLLAFEGSPKDILSVTEYE